MWFLLGFLLLVPLLGIAFYVGYRDRIRVLSSSKEDLEDPQDKVDASVAQTSGHPLPPAWDIPPHRQSSPSRRPDVLLHTTAVTKPIENPWAKRKLIEEYFISPLQDVDRGFLIHFVLDSLTPTLEEMMERPDADESFESDLTEVFGPRSAELAPLRRKLRELWTRALLEKDPDFQTHLEEVFQGKAHSFSAPTMESLELLWQRGRSPENHRFWLGEHATARAHVCVEIALAKGHRGNEAEIYALQLMDYPDQQLVELARENRVRAPFLR